MPYPEETHTPSTGGTLIYPPGHVSKYKIKYFFVLYFNSNLIKYVFTSVGG